MYEQTCSENWGNVEPGNDGYWNDVSGDLPHKPVCKMPWLGQAQECQDKGRREANG